MVALLTGCSGLSRGPASPTPVIAVASAPAADETGQPCHVTISDQSLTLPTPEEVQALLRTGPAAASSQPSIKPEPVSSASASSAPTPATADSGNAPYTLYIPPKHPSGPLWVLVTLHGFGENGVAFSKPFQQIADTNGWVLVSPTFDYTSLEDPLKTRTDDIRFAQDLSQILTQLPQQTGLKLQSRALILGFSRGGSMAERFALIHPEQVQAVAALSGGAYTLPQPCLVKDGHSEPLPLPLGTADIQTWTGHPLDTAAFKRIPFWLSVGADDDQARYLPSQYDVMIGDTRVQRGFALQRALNNFGVSAQFTIFPGLAHVLNPAVITQSTAFLAAATKVS